MLEVYNRDTNGLPIRDLKDSTGKTLASRLDSKYGTAGATFVDQPKRSLLGFESAAGLIGAIPPGMETEPVRPQLPRGPVEVPPEVGARMLTQAPSTLTTASAMPGLDRLSSMNPKPQPEVMGPPAPASAKTSSSGMKFAGARRALELFDKGDLNEDEARKLMDEEDEAAQPRELSYGLGASSELAPSTARFYQRKFLRTSARAGDPAARLMLRTKPGAPASSANSYDPSAGVISKWGKNWQGYSDPLAPQ